MQCYYCCMINHKFKRRILAVQQNKFEKRLRPGGSSAQISIWLYNGSHPLFIDIVYWMQVIIVWQQKYEHEKGSGIGEVSNNSSHSVQLFCVTPGKTPFMYHSSLTWWSFFQTLAQVKLLTDSCDTASIAPDNPDEICHPTLDPSEVTYLLRFVIHWLKTCFCW